MQVVGDIGKCLEHKLVYEPVHKQVLNAQIENQMRKFDLNEQSDHLTSNSKQTFCLTEFTRRYRSKPFFLTEKA